MTVKELIEKLKNMPQDKNIEVWDSVFADDHEVVDVKDMDGCTVYIEIS